MFKKINYAPISWILPIVLIVLLFLARFNLHYLVFHSIAEYFAVFVSLGITLVSYYTYTFTKNRYLLFIGLGYFWVAILDILHTQTYAGMPLYHVHGSDTSLTFWIFARLLAASILLIAPFMRHRKFKPYVVLLLFGALSSIVIYTAMFSPPSLLVDGVGLTPLKINLEYLVIAILLLTLYINKKRVDEFSELIYKTMAYSIILTILAEVSFTLYIDAYGIMNVIGHIFKFLSFWILLQAIIRTSLEQPFKVMKQSSTTYNVIPYPAIVVDSQGVVRQVNQAACDTVDKVAKDIIGKNNHQLYHPQDIDEEECHICQAITKGETLNSFELKDEQFNTVKHYSLSPIKSEESSVQGMVQVSVDITHLKNLENSLLNQYKLLQNIIDTVPTRIFWKDIDGKFLGANSVFVQDAKLNSREDLIGKSDFEMVWGDKEAQLYRDDDIAVMNSGEPKLQFEETQTNDTGETIILSTSKVPLRDINGETIGIVGTYEDITKRKATEDELQKQKEVLRYKALHDELTNLPNRLLLQDRLSHAVEKAKRHGSKFALLFMDLDQFKQINDTLGHQVGDQVLKIFSKRLQESVREEDTISRHGGDEFTILLEDIKEIEYVSILAQKLLDVTKEPMHIEGHTLHIFASIGISIYPTDSTNIHDLLKYSDSAMYKAKDEGRNNFQFYSSELTKIAMKKVMMQNDLRVALEREELEVYYQPQIEVTDTHDRLVGVEALVRWNHPRLGMVSPAEFISIAEESGMIIELDRQVMNIAIKQLALWYKENLNPGVLSLNLAMKQLKQDDFISTIEQTIEDSGLKDTKKVAFEITESDLMKDPDSSIEKLNSLKELGIELAIDDFGTGYSSLSYLKSLPVSKLKIDQSFTNGIPKDKDDVALVKTIISLAENLKMRVIAEGVETEEQKRFMYENGCSEIQGYYYSKPLSSRDMRDFMLSFGK